MISKHEGQIKEILRPETSDELVNIALSLNVMGLKTLYLPQVRFLSCNQTVSNRTVRYTKHN